MNPAKHFNSTVDKYVVLRILLGLFKNANFTMTATMIVSLRSLFCLVFDFVDPECLVFNLYRDFQFIFLMNKSFLMVLIIFK